jgi:hypothetical protein
MAILEDMAFARGSEGTLARKILQSNLLLRAVIDKIIDCSGTFTSGNIITVGNFARQLTHSHCPEARVAAEDSTSWHSTWDWTRVTRLVVTQSGGCVGSISTAPTKLLHLPRLIAAFNNNKPFNND